MDHELSATNLLLVAVMDFAAHARYSAVAARRAGLNAIAHLVLLRRSHSSVRSCTTINEVATPADDAQATPFDLLQLVTHCASQLLFVNLIVSRSRKRLGLPLPSQKSAYSSRHAAILREARHPYGDGLGSTA